MDKFQELINANCFSNDEEIREKAAQELECLYGCEIYCGEMDKGVLFAHHARGCTIIAAKICSGVVIYQNVTIGSNLKYNKAKQEWENVGNPIIAENVIICDGAKILGPVIIGANTVVAAGAIITKDIPSNCLAYGINQYKLKDKNYDLVFGKDMPSGDAMKQVNTRLIAAFMESNQKK